VPASTDLSRALTAIKKHKDALWDVYRKNPTAGDKFEMFMVDNPDVRDFWEDICQADLDLYDSVKDLVTIGFSDE
jgi:hypothetical protein